MNHPARRLLIPVLAVALIPLAGPPPLEGQARPSDPPRKVLVELYSSQGCSSCPPAADLVGQLAGMGYGPDHAVVINFHVDYFNEPWADPFSNKAYSRRQLAYNEVQKRDDLYFTPLLMIDGRLPMLGSDRDKVASGLRQAVKGTPEVAIELAWNGDAGRRTLAVKLGSPSAGVVGRELLVGVALTEDPVTTRVPSGENAGRTLVEHHVARRFEQQFATLDKADPKALTFPLQLPADANPARFRVAVFAQDRKNGKVYQADSIPWTIPKAADPKSGTQAHKDRARRANRRILAELEARLGMNAAGSAGTTTAPCPDCGSDYIPWTIPTLPRGYTLPPGIQLPPVPKLSC